MEIANPGTVRQATLNDRSALQQLLREAPLTHFHADWFLPVDWLGRPTFLVGETGAIPDRQPTLLACLAAAADPPPAAWVRVAAVGRDQDPLAWLQHLLPPIEVALREAGVSTLGWLAAEGWPDHWLPKVGFRPINAIETYIHTDLTAVPDIPIPPITIRPAIDDDLPALSALEEAAFDPLWRHSVAALRRARPHTIIFDVAELDGRPVGFQYSTGTQDGGAHLVRLTVDPTVQRGGIGSALLARALAEYRRRRLTYVSLNTQADNFPSKRLYAKFNFRPSGRPMPVWALSIA